MKNLVFIVLLSSTISCSTSSEEYYFDYDYIEHYYIEQKGHVLYDNYDNIPNLEKLKIDLIQNSKPETLSDSSFIHHLGEIGFTKNEIPKSNYSDIREIFKDREIYTISSSVCAPIFRDILIFKKNNGTVGVAKICFECSYGQIVGTEVNTMDFGQQGNYTKLKKLLIKE